METTCIRPVLEGNSQPLDFSNPTALDLCVRNKEETFQKNDSLEIPEDNNNNHNNPTNIDNFSTKFNETTPTNGIKLKFQPKIENRDLVGYNYDNFVAPSVGMNPPLCIASPCSDTSEISSVSSTASELGDSPRLRQLRPFKAYPRTALPLEGSLSAFQEFRQKFISPLQESRATNKNMRRTTIRSVGKTIDDPQYLEKRRKNNEAAKRSRDARRMKEDEIAIRAAFLEREVIQLNQKLACREAKIEQLEMLLYRYTHSKS